MVTFAPSHVRRRARGPNLVVAVMVLVATLVALPAVPVSAATAYDEAIDLTFPIAGTYRYMDDYHHWRGGGTRRHRATDIMVDYGEPVYAAMGGKVDLITGIGTAPPSWGYAIYVAGDDGRRYVYIHLGRQDGPASEAYAPGIGLGTRVARGQHIGFAGHSGNASASAPHLHLEIHDPRITDPYGTHRMNPYASLRAAERRGDFPGVQAESEPEPKCHAFAGDWDGTGRDGQGWWCDGAIRLRTASGAELRYHFGRRGDVPVVADWNADGRDTVSIVRRSTWHIREQPEGGAADRTFTYGRVQDGDVPITGAWNGDGKDAVGIIRDGEWHLRPDQSGGNGTTVFTFGRISAGDRALIGDWNADGADTVGIVRGREWHLRHSLSGGPGETVYIYGRVLQGDTPVMGNWTGDGIATPGIVRDADWHLRHEHGGGPADEIVSFARP